MLNECTTCTPTTCHNNHQYRRKILPGMSVCRPRKRKMRDSERCAKVASNGTQMYLLFNEDEVHHRRIFSPLEDSLGQSLRETVGDAWRPLKTCHIGFSVPEKLAVLICAGSLHTQTQSKIDRQQTPPHHDVLFSKSHGALLAIHP